MQLTLLETPSGELVAALDVAPLPRRPRRVLMYLQDAGAYGYSQWLCTCCWREVEVFFTDEDWPESYREPCPWCGPVYDQLASTERRGAIDGRLQLVHGAGEQGRGIALVPIYGPKHRGTT